MTEPIDLAYAAGIIDGEGSISISVAQPNYGRNSPYYYVLVKVGNTDLVLVNWLRKSFGGSIQTHEYNNSKWKTLYTWSLSTQQAARFLEDILPYLKLKWEQAEIALNLCSVTSSCNREGLSDLDINYRQVLKEAMHILNKRGV